MQPIQPRGFYVSTDNIFDDKSWSDPIYFDMIGIDQDVSDALYPAHSLNWLVD